LATPLSACAILGQSREELLSMYPWDFERFVKLDVFV
jgi:hypothetical protein